MKLGGIYEAFDNSSISIFAEIADKHKKFCENLAAVTPDLAAVTSDPTVLKTVADSFSLVDSVMAGLVQTTSSRQSTSPVVRQEPEVTEIEKLRSKYDEVILAKDTEIREKDRIIAELIDMIPEKEEPSG